MNKLLYACSVPIIAVFFGFANPKIDLNHNIKKSKQKGTEKLESPKTIRKFQEFRKKLIF